MEGGKKRKKGKILTRRKGWKICLYFIRREERKERKENDMTEFHKKRGNEGGYDCIS